MAVERTNKPAAQAPGHQQQPDSAASAQPAPEMNSNQYAGHQQTPPPPPEQPGLMSLNAQFRRNGATERSEVRSAQALQALKEAQKEAQATQDVGEDHVLLRFDRDQNQVGLSSILVVKAVSSQR